MSFDLYDKVFNRKYLLLSAIIKSIRLWSIWVKKIKSNLYNKALYMHFHPTHVALRNLDTKETLKTLLKGRCHLKMAKHLL